MRDKTYGVIFDMDGILIDSHDAHLRAFNKMGEKLGVPFGREMMLRTIGMHNRQIFPFWLGREIPEAELEALALEKESLYRSFAPQVLKPIAGSQNLVKTLASEGFKLVVGSSGPRANVELALRVLGLTSYFHDLCTGDDVREGKPNPEIFLKAAAKLQLSPQSCVVIEDAPQGVKAARAAKIPVIAVTTSVTAKELNEATLVVSSLTELTSDQIRTILQACVVSRGD